MGLISLMLGLIGYCHEYMRENVKTKLLIQNITAHYLGVGEMFHMVLKFTKAYLSFYFCVCLLLMTISAHVSTQHVGITSPKI